MACANKSMRNCLKVIISFHFRLLEVNLISETSAIKGYSSY